MKLGEADRELSQAVEVAGDAVSNGNKNGRLAAARVIAALAPLLLRAEEPRIKALGVALTIAAKIVVGQRTKKAGKT